LKHSFTAIVPMRHDSERVPGKNWRPLGGRPLFCHIVDTLNQCPLIGQIVIDTDSDTIRSIARREFPAVRVLERPEHLRDDRLPMNQVLLNTVQQCEGEYFIQTHSTNPLLKAATISAALQKFVDADRLFDSVFGVTPFQQRLWDRFTKPVNHNPAILRRTQDLVPLYTENSCLYVFSRTTLEDYGNRIGGRPLMVEIERDEAWDIDTETDFTIAEMLYSATRFNKAAA